MESFIRTELLIGKDNLEKLKNSSVAVFGVGGVGGFAVEALVRSGVGNITVFDGDVVDKSNLNRQIISTVNNVGEDKVSVIKDRALSINPNLNFTANKVFYLPEKASEYDLSKFDYIIDAIDTVTAKLDIIVRANTLNVPVISCMGTGGKLDSSLLTVADITKTHTCPLARVMRRELKARGIEKLKVVYSPEDRKGVSDGVVPSMIFVPAAAGILLAERVVKDLIGEK